MRACGGFQCRTCLCPYVLTPPIHLDTTHISRHAPCLPPYILCTSVCSPYTICSPNVMGTLGACVPPICLGVFGQHQYICQAFCVYQYIHCLSVHKSYSCSPSLWVASLLDWMPMDVCYGSCCCSFFVVFSLCLNLLLPRLQFLLLQ